MYDGAKSILAEIDSVLQRVAQAQVDDLVDAMLGARQVVVYGLGREGLVMWSSSNRL